MFWLPLNNEPVGAESCCQRPLVAESCLSFQQIQSELKDRFTAKAAPQDSTTSTAAIEW